MAKGQLWSYDIIVAVTVFIFTLAVASILSMNIAAGTGSDVLEDLSNSAWDFSGTLMSPGNPSDWNASVNASDLGTWNTSAITLLGMLESFDSPRISQSKAADLINMSASSYPALKAKFRTGYDFFVEVEEHYNCSDPSINNSAYYNCSGRGIPSGSEEWQSLEHSARVGSQNFTFGLDPDRNHATFKAVSNRIAVHNNSVVHVRVVLWTNQTR
ncbi:MAG: hypothetical protein PHF51_04550 [Candidatus ainarchaeum sp.]|nr:hypothetical protein [Candidatus ainarchaeum sp.]